MIDFTFITKLEGNECKGYVPDPKNSQSGVTIAAGFDLGQRDAQEIENAFELELAGKLLPYVGVIKEHAQQLLAENPLIITEEENVLINDYCKGSSTRCLKDLWAKSDALVSFDGLPGECQTVIASVAFQYGNLSKRTLNFWHQATSGDWTAVEENLRNFGDKYAPRKNKEADLLASGLRK